MATAYFKLGIISILVISSSYLFSLNGLGLLGYEAIMTRDYPVIFGSMYIFALLGLILKLISDITYCIIDPRINFDTKSL